MGARRPPRHLAVPALLVGALLGAGCGGSSSATFTLDLDIEVDESHVPEVPAALEDGDAVGVVPCATLNDCPLSDVILFACAAGVCEPLPADVGLTVRGGIDLEALLDELEPLLRVREVEVLGVTATVVFNDLNADLGPVALGWRDDPPSGITSTPLAGWPGLAAGSTDLEPARVDPEGAAMLGEHLVDSPRARITAASSVDLVPGAPLPRGAARLRVGLELRVSGTLP
ncbi:MAG: hypothetical protein ACFCGT_16365 [Sandaracinaceae bacterium]